MLVLQLAHCNILSQESFKMRSFPHITNT